MKKLLFLFTIGLFGLTLAGCGTTASTSTTNQTSQIINIYSRDDASGTREAFENGIGFNKTTDSLVNTAIVTSGNGDQATKVGNDDNAIGYVSLSTNMAANNIKTLDFEGVQATEANVLNGTYLLKRPFMYTLRADGDFTSTDNEQMAKAFIAYLGTQDGMSVLAAAGAIENPTSSTPTWDDIKANYPITLSTSTITIKTGGSTSVQESIEAAANAFHSECSAFVINMNETGSADGYKRTLGTEKDSNYADIGFASRPFQTTEDVSTAASSGQFATDAVAIVVSVDNNMITNITADQLKKIYTGEITTWNQLQN